MQGVYAQDEHLRQAETISDVHRGEREIPREISCEIRREISRGMRER